MNNKFTLSFTSTSGTYVVLVKSHIVGFSVQGVELGKRENHNTVIHIEGGLSWSVKASIKTVVTAWEVAGSNSI